jgi:hypothetical protein
MFKRILVARRQHHGATRPEGRLRPCRGSAPDAVQYVIDKTAALPPIDSGFVPADYLEDRIDSLHDAGREWLLPALKRSARQRRSTTTDGRTRTNLNRSICCCGNTYRRQPATAMNIGTVLSTGPRLARVSASRGVGASGQAYAGWLWQTR